jgi:tRNA U55 pseudouridine synthase TruB
MPITTETVVTCDACEEVIESVPDLNANPVFRPHSTFGPGTAVRVLCIYCAADDEKVAEYKALIRADADKAIDSQRPALAAQETIWAKYKLFASDPSKMDEERARLLETWRTVKKEG